MTANTLKNIAKAQATSDVETMINFINNDMMSIKKFKRQLELNMAATAVKELTFAIKRATKLDNHDASVMASDIAMLFDKILSFCKASGKKWA